MNLKAKLLGTSTAGMPLASAPARPDPRNIMVPPELWEMIKGTPMAKGYAPVQPMPLNPRARAR